MYKVSLIIPPCAAQSELRACLDSIAAQITEDVEILCIDDGSCGGCADTVAEYAARRGNIRLIRQEGKSLSDIAAAVSQAAQGEYVFFLNGAPARKEAQLSLRLRAAEKKLRVLEEEKRRRPVERIRRFFKSVRRRGLAYYIRAALWKTGAIFARFMSSLTRGAAWAYFTLAAEKGFRFARQELPKLRRDEQLRRQMKKGAVMPLVSVIIPVHNAQTYLKECLESLVFQTLASIEIICVDDGSTDGSLQLLRRYEKKDCRVRVFTQKNQYAGAARNLGLRKARGEYVLFLDADDFFEKTLAEDAYLAAKQDDADAVLYGARLYNDVTKATMEAPWLLVKHYLPAPRPFNRNDCPDTLLQITTPCSWTKMFRRQFLLDCGLQFPPLRNAEDVSYTFGALAMAERITILDKALVYYRTNIRTSLEATKSAVPLCFYEGYKALLDKLKELGLLEQLRRSYVNATLAGCLYNLQTQNDPKSKQSVEEALSAYVFRDLELTGYEPSYYYQNDLYRQMQTILGAGKAKE